MNFMYSMKEKIYFNYYQNTLEKMNNREEEISLINTASRVEERKKKVKDQFLQLTGGGYEYNRLLSARVTGEINQEGYKIEKVIFEALPDYFIPGNLYLPHDCNNRRPALLLPVGHDPLGKASHEYQKLAGNLARKGYVAFVYDPVGQGERDLLPHRIEERVRKDMWCVEQHMRAGNPGYLLGRHLSYYFINDSKRAIDYLVTREEVNPEKIGAIGRSGGGTNTAYLCASEDRLKLAIPIHFTTNFKRMLKISSPGDVEQTFFGYIEKGLDIPDLYWPFIGKPLLLNLGIKDFFPIEGAREAYQELNRMYSLIGQEDMIDKVEFNIGHEPSKEIRESCYQWVNKWFGSGDETAGEENIEVLDEKELYCTKEGITGRPGRTIFEINFEKYQKLKNNYKTVPDEEFIKQTKELIGQRRHFFRYETALEEKKYLNTGYSYQILNFYDNEQNSSTCEYLYSNNNNLLVILDFNGRFRWEDILSNSESRDILKINLPGQEITKKSTSSDETGYNEDYQLYLLSILNGEALLATRIKHTLYAIKHLIEERGIDYKVELVGSGQGGIIALFATLLLKQKVTYLTAADFISLYGNLFNDINYKIEYSSLLPDILKKFDLDMLTYYTTLRAQRVRLVNLTNERGAVEDLEPIQEKYRLLIENGVKNVSFIQDLKDYSSLLG